MEHILRNTNLVQPLLFYKFGSRGGAKHLSTVGTFCHLPRSACKLGIFKPTTHMMKLRLEKLN